jgi:hypothetical protein
MFMDIGKDITRSNTNCLFVRNVLFSSLCLPLSCSDVSHGEWIEKSDYELVTMEPRTSTSQFSFATKHHNHYYRTDNKIKS